MTERGHPHRIRVQACGILAHTLTVFWHYSFPYRPLPSGFCADGAPTLSSHPATLVVVVRAPQVNRGEAPAPLYLPQDALEPYNEEHVIEHPRKSKLFEEPVYNAHRGNVYRPTSRLRLWQQEQAEERDQQQRKERMSTLGSKKSQNPYDAMKDPWQTRG